MYLFRWVLLNRIGGAIRRGQQKNGMHCSDHGFGKRRLGGWGLGGAFEKWASTHGVYVSRGAFQADPATPIRCGWRWIAPALLHAPSRGAVAGGTLEGAGQAHQLELFLGCFIE